jgi:hypothetical protein
MSAPGLPFFELCLVQVCAPLFAWKRAHGEAPDGGDRGLSGSREEPVTEGSTVTADYVKLDTAA